MFKARKITGSLHGGAAPVPVNTVLPAITGTTTVGSTLSCSTGTWTNTPTGYAYQWLRNGVAIPSATSSTYLLVSADLAANISCTVTATNATGSTAATANAVGPITSGAVTPALKFNVPSNSQYVPLVAL